MFKSKSFIILMVCLLLMLAVGVVNAQEVKTDNTEADSNSIDLYTAKINYLYGTGGALGYNASGYVGVPSNNFPTNVTIHYTYNDGNGWNDVNAQYMGLAPDGNHIWYFETPEIFPMISSYFSFPCEFAIKYEVNGQVYWDNNNQQNYLVNYSTVPVVDNIPVLLKRSVVILNNASRSNNTINGSVNLKNLAYYKEVKVVYTLDNWQTTNTVSANYNKSYDNDVEVWDFTINNIPEDAQVKYYIDYTVNGTHYYDNNFGSDYTI